MSTRARVVHQGNSSIILGITKGHLLICDGWFDTWIVQKKWSLDNDKRCC